MMQSHVLRRAGLVLATTRASTTALRALCDEAGGKAQVDHIYNGYDPNDFLSPGPAAWEADRPYRLAYVGTLWNLASLAPLVSAVGELSRSRPDLAARLEIIFAGRRTQPQQAYVDALKAFPCRIVEHPFLGHAEAISLMRRADGLLILLSDLPGAGRIVSAKLFESMAARKPILAISPRGELWDLMAEYPASHCFLPKDSTGIAECLAEEISHRPALRNGALSLWDASRFDRRVQAGELARFLDGLAGGVSAETLVRSS